MSEEEDNIYESLDKLDLSNTLGGLIRIIEKPTNSTISKIKDIKWDQESQIRSGIIPYIIDNQGKIYFAMGKDYKFKSLTDFGGGVKKGKRISDRNPLETAFRELKEESFNTFINGNSYENSYCIKDNDMIILFIKFYDSMNSYTSNFRSRISKVTDKSTIEISEIVWINEDDFVKYLTEDNKIIYIKVRHLLYQNIKELVNLLKLE